MDWYACRNLPRSRMVLCKHSRRLRCRRSWSASLRSFFHLQKCSLAWLLTLGLWTRLALVSGGLLIIALVFGTALRSDWDTLGIQMIYAAIYYLLLVGRTCDRFSIDNLRQKNS